jgi:murein DD-endopeptidase MepM/ murein hydrolase activator NlpD
LQSASGVRHLALPGWVQATLLAASLAMIGAVAYVCTGLIHLRDTVDRRAADVTLPGGSPFEQGQPSSLAAAPAVTMPGSNTPAPSADPIAPDAMRSELAVLRQQLAALDQNYAEARASYQQAAEKLAALMEQNSQLQSQLADANTRSKAMQEAREQAERRAKASEQALNSKAGNSEQLAKNLEAARNELQQSESRRTTLQNRVQELQMDLQAALARANQSELRNPQVATDPLRVPPPPAVGQPSALEVAPPERKPPSNGAPHSENNAAKSSELERLLASTGLDIDRLLRGFGTTSGEGGPYIALSDPRAGAPDHQRLEELKKLAKNLPLASPLNQYQLGSDYGARVDPINHKESFHPGLDMDAAYRSTVYSTGAGIVIFTGNMDSYGKVVELDHGHGIITRYAHLHRILVAKGQKVGLHTPIAELGSTGRSTGPHLHYEVRVDGQTVDPAKFMQAGKNVVQISGQQ